MISLNLLLWRHYDVTNPFNDITRMCHWRVNDGIRNLWYLRICFRVYLLRSFFSITKELGLFIGGPSIVRKKVGFTFSFTIVLCQTLGDLLGPGLIIDWCVFVGIFRFPKQKNHFRMSVPASTEYPWTKTAISLLPSSPLSLSPSSPFPPPPSPLPPPPCSNPPTPLPPALTFHCS